jgi:hypothetical protein
MPRQPEDSDAERERASKALGWTQVGVTIVGFIGTLVIAGVPAVMWAGTTATDVQNLKAQRVTDRQEAREDIKGVHDEIRDLGKKIDVLLERRGR